MACSGKKATCGGALCKILPGAPAVANVVNPGVGLQRLNVPYAEQDNSSPAGVPSTTSLSTPINVPSFTACIPDGCKQVMEILRADWQLDVSIPTTADTVILATYGFLTAFDPGSTANTPTYDYNYITFFEEDWYVQPWYLRYIPPWITGPAKLLKSRPVPVSQVCLWNSNGPSPQR